MGTPEYRANYRAAIQEANSQLAEIFREFEDLNQRKEKLEDVVGALEPFISRNSAENQHQEPAAPSQFHHQPERFEPAAPEPVVLKEPVAPASFAPVAEVITDPIQSRINHALGLAVA